MAEQTKTITYRGGPGEAHILVRMLRAEGVQVDWEPPEERRDLGGALQDYVVELLATGTVAAISHAVGKFRRLGRGAVESQDEDKDKNRNEEGD